MSQCVKRFVVVRRLGREEGSVHALLSLARRRRRRFRCLYEEGELIFVSLLGMDSVMGGAVFGQTFEALSINRFLHKGVILEHCCIIILTSIQSLRNRSYLQLLIEF